MSKYLVAPFTDEQVQALNEFQTHLADGFAGHPYTCSNRGDGRHGNQGGDIGVLVATNEGWVCPHCEYRQYTAHPYMLGASVPSILAQKSLEIVDSRITNLIIAYESLGIENPQTLGVQIMIDCLKSRKSKLKEQVSIYFN